MANVNYLKNLKQYNESKIYIEEVGSKYTQNFSIQQYKYHCSCHIINFKVYREGIF